jgi:hypothetical protein
MRDVGVIWISVMPALGEMPNALLSLVDVCVGKMGMIATFACTAAPRVPGYVVQMMVMPDSLIALAACGLV